MSTVVFIETDWFRAVIVIVFFVAYQQFENHVVQPLVYGRTVQLSPLAVLCAVLVGAQLAGILGALLAIPVAGSLLAVAREILQERTRPATSHSARSRVSCRSGFPLVLGGTGERRSTRRARIRPGCSFTVVLLVLAVFGGFGYSHR